MTMQAATEWAKYGVWANAVVPGGVKTKAMAAMITEQTLVIDGGSSIVGY